MLVNGDVLLWIDGRRDWIEERPRVVGQVFAIRCTWNGWSSLPYGCRVGSVRGCFKLCVERSSVTTSASTFQPISRLHRRDQWVSGCLSMNQILKCNMAGHQAILLTLFHEGSTTRSQGRLAAADMVIGLLGNEVYFRIGFTSS
jgi:hypothetical protein